jgi:hypothetical protein
MGTCESCGRTEEELTRVQRVYLLPPEESPQGPDGAPDGDLQPSVGDIEWWCASCAATFPHVPLPLEDDTA